MSFWLKVNFIFFSFWTCCSTCNIVLGHSNIILMITFMTPTHNPFHFLSCVFICWSVNRLCSGYPFLGQIFLTMIALLLGCAAVICLKPQATFYKSITLVHGGQPSSNFSTKLSFVHYPVFFFHFQKIVVGFIISLLLSSVQITIISSTVSLLNLYNLLAFFQRNF